MARRKSYEVDYLDYVQKAIATIPRGDLTKVAAAAGVSVRTIQNLAKGDRNAYYPTVMNLYNVFKEGERKQAAAVKGGKA